MNVTKEEQTKIRRLFTQLRRLNPDHLLLLLDERRGLPETWEIFAGRVARHVLSEKGLSHDLGEAIALEREGAGILIKKAHMEDSDEVRRLLAQSDECHHVLLPQLFLPTTEFHYDDQFFYSVISNPKACYVVAIKEGRVLGFVMASIEGTEDGLLAYRHRSWLLIRDVVVGRDYQRSGVGSMLLWKVLRWGMSHGLKGAMLEVHAGNEAALSLYRQLGFHVTSQVMRREL